jgi:hypothetical protein
MQRDALNRLLASGLSAAASEFLLDRVSITDHKDVALRILARTMSR